MFSVLCSTFNARFSADWVSNIMSDVVGGHKFVPVSVESAAAAILSLPLSSSLLMMSMRLLIVLIIRSTCNSRDTLLAEALIYRLRGHYVGLRRKSGLIRYIRADIRSPLCRFLEIGINNSFARWRAISYTA